MLGSIDKGEFASETPSDRAGGPGAVCFQIAAGGSGFRTGPSQRGSDFFARPEEPPQPGGRRFGRQLEAVPGAGDRSIE